MPLVWPPSLADVLSREGWGEAFPDMVLATPMSRGPAKIRRATTAAVRPWSLTLQPMSKAQVDTLDEFFTGTTQGGALPFELAHPRLGTRLVQFKPGSPPRPSWLSGPWWRVRLTLEILP